ncbi:DUF2625 family protein [Nocardia sp. NPDC051787]|uniref:DUF2625 family protein n=1 Tax=Nocardia sp. NPDC051787 TaxID=3155415 RepID=UPI00341389B2
MRDLTTLIEVDDPAWPELSAAIADAAVRVDTAAVHPGVAHATLRQLQVTARSYLGGLVLNCGGLMVDDGWVRVYGSPLPGDAWQMPGFARVNGFPVDARPDGMPVEGLVVAHDVLGGVFVLNGTDPAAAGRPGRPGEMIYFAPETLGWVGLDCGYSDWLGWLFAGGLADFYADVRWPGWRGEVRQVSAAQGLSVVPFLWAEDSGGAPRSRRPVPLHELLGMGREFSTRLSGTDPGFLGFQ